MCSKVLFLAALNTLKLLRHNVLFLFIFLQVNEKCFCNRFKQRLVIFLNNKTYMLSKTIFRHLNIGLKRNFFFNVSQKNSFLESNLIQKHTKQQYFHPKKTCQVIFSYKNLMYWFLGGCFAISAPNNVPNLFSTLNCLFAMN